MKFSNELNKEINKFKELDNIIYFNSLNSEIINDLFLESDNFKELILEELNLNPKINIHEYYLKLIKDYLFELDKNQKDIILNNYLLNNIKELKQEDYLNNPYINDIKINDIKYKNYHLYYDFYNPYELFLYKDLTIANDYKEINHLGYFKEEFKFISLDKDDISWMLITPHEINTMKKAIKEAKNNVLVYGLGLGYFPYLIQLKEEVNKITIIEKDQNIIELFNQFILPFFKNKNKIKIINEDAFLFKKPSSYYDYNFIDLWHNQEDGLYFYIKFKKQENNNEKYFYWIENSCLAYFRRLLITLFIEKINNVNPKIYLKAKTNEDKIINSLYFYFKDYKFDNFNQIIELLSNENLIKIIKECPFNL